MRLSLHTGLVFILAMGVGILLALLSVKSNVSTQLSQWKKILEIPHAVYYRQWLQMRNIEQATQLDVDMVKEMAVPLETHQVILNIFLCDDHILQLGRTQGAVSIRSPLPFDSEHEYYLENRKKLSFCYSQFPWAQTPPFWGLFPHHRLRCTKAYVSSCAISALHLITVLVSMPTRALHWCDIYRPYRC